MLVIIDYKTGNLLSIKNILKRIGVNAEITNDKGLIEKATKIILPGVGHFDYGMGNLKSLALIDLLNEKVINQKTPVLGICLGAQLLTKGSEEGSKPGLGWINGYTKAFDKSKLVKQLKVPHMGWSDVKYKSTSKLFQGYTGVPRFYFVHSYHLVCENEQDELTHCDHGYEIVAGVEHENILGVQFHPEKSHKFGMKLLENFVKNY
jgi:imidazole glycerol-phosphate synthase subunit HisH